jgi:hypothetical protein
VMGILVGVDRHLYTMVVCSPFPEAAGIAVPHRSAPNFCNEVGIML